MIYDLTNFLGGKCGGYCIVVYKYVVVFRELLEVFIIF